MRAPSLLLGIDVAAAIGGCKGGPPSKAETKPGMGLKSIIDNGMRPSGMPGSSGTLSNDEIWSIAVYIRHLHKAGSLGEPPMYNQ